MFIAPNMIFQRVTLFSKPRVDLYSRGYIIAELSENFRTTHRRIVWRKLPKFDISVENANGAQLDSRLR